MVFQKKPFKTIKEQIELLESRGMLIPDKVYASNYLLSNNYYNIINGYSKYFMSQHDTYIPGTSFNEVTRLYQFDRDMKQAFFKSILCIEGHLKSIFAYHFAEEYASIPYAYLNTSCYDKEKVLSVVTTIYHLSGIINHYRKQTNNSITHYCKKYNSVPIWVLVNYLDFGELRHMISASTTRLQNKIARDMESFIQQNIQKPGVFPPETMLSFIENLNDLRNICAHNNRLIDYHCRRDSKYWEPLLDTYGLTANGYRNNVYSVMLSTQCFLSHIEYAFLHNSIRKLMNTHLKNHIKTIPYNTIIQTLGYPDNWPENESKISQ